MSNKRSRVLSDTDSHSESDSDDHELAARIVVHTPAGSGSEFEGFSTSSSSDSEQDALMYDVLDSNSDVSPDSEEDYDSAYDATTDSDQFSLHPLLDDPYSTSETESEVDSEEGGVKQHYGGPVFVGEPVIEPQLDLAFDGKERDDIDYLLFPVLVHQLANLSGSLWDCHVRPFDVSPVEAEHHGIHRCLIASSPWRVFIPIAAKHAWCEQINTLHHSYSAVSPTDWFSFNNSYSVNADALCMSLLAVGVAEVLVERFNMKWPLMSAMDWIQFHLDCRLHLIGDVSKPYYENREQNPTVVMDVSHTEVVTPHQFHVISLAVEGSKPKGAKSTIPAPTASRVGHVKFQSHPGLGLLGQHVFGGFKLFFRVSSF